jgi:hypothetical protein
MLHLTGLTDDYVMDGRVITEILGRSGDLRRIAGLGRCYKQVNASVGTFGTDTLLASTRALASGSRTDDSEYKATEAKLAWLANRRDAFAQRVKEQLDAVEFHHRTLDRRVVDVEVGLCNALLRQAHRLATA